MERSPASERATTVIVSSDYGVAGRCRSIGNSRLLPASFSPQLSDYYWLPTHLGATDALMVGYAPSDVAWMCTSATVVAHLTVPYHVVNLEQGARSPIARLTRRSQSCGCGSKTSPRIAAAARPTPDPLAPTPRRRGNRHWRPRAQIRHVPGCTARRHRVLASVRGHPAGHVEVSNRRLRFHVHEWCPLRVGEVNAPEGSRRMRNRPSC